MSSACSAHPASLQAQSLTPSAGLSSDVLFSWHFCRPPLKNCSFPPHVLYLLPCFSFLLNTYYWQCRFYRAAKNIFSVVLFCCYLDRKKAHKVHYACMIYFSHFKNNMSLSLIFFRNYRKPQWKNYNPPIVPLLPLELTFWGVLRRKQFNTCSR